MIIYEVNLTIEFSIYSEFKLWLLAHVEQMVQFNGFIEAKILEEVESKEHKKITVSYLLDSQKSLDVYLKHHAPEMRQDGIDKFGSKFSATRRVFEIVETIKPIVEHNHFL